MSETLKTGLSATRHVDVDRARTISFMGEDCRVYSTPNLLYDIEMACRDLLLAHIEPGKDSVGTRVELDHVGATLLGMWVDITVTISDVNGPAVTFDFTARVASRNERSSSVSTGFRARCLEPRRNDSAPSLSSVNLVAVTARACSATISARLAFACALGLTPSANSARNSSLLCLASSKETSGNTPHDKVFCFPPKRNLNRHHLLPDGATSIYSPLASVSLYGFSRVSALATASVVSTMGPATV